jgi:hypothetical protein
MQKFHWNMQKFHRRQFNCELSVCHWNKGIIEKHHRPNGEQKRTSGNRTIKEQDKHWQKETLWIRPSSMMEQLIFLYSSYSASTSFTETPRKHTQKNISGHDSRRKLSHRERGTSQRSASRELCSRSRDGDGRVRHVVRGRNASWIVVPNFCYEYES